MLLEFSPRNTNQSSEPNRSYFEKGEKNSHRLSCYFYILNLIGLFEQTVHLPFPCGFTISFLQFSYVNTSQNLSVLKKAELVLLLFRALCRNKSSTSPYWQTYMYTSIYFVLHHVRNNWANLNESGSI